eukprot:11198990-Lingulodinium_polyedra.AAC.1
MLIFGVRRRESPSCRQCRSVRRKIRLYQGGETWTPNSKLKGHMGGRGKSGRQSKATLCIHGMWAVTSE